jgi:TetR/AcrR family transcriptional regulator, cholesterol catabolism regulator
VRTTREGEVGARGGAAGTTAGDGSMRSQRRAHLVALAGELFAQKGYRATTVREIADAAGILSGSLYHHFDSKESIADEILSSFINEVLADYRGAVASAQGPRAALEQIVRSTSLTLSRHRAALAMLQNDWSYFAAQPRFAYLSKALREIERIWVTQLEAGKQAGLFRPDLDAKLTYRLLRDILWIPEQWRRTRGYSTDQIVDAFLRILFDGIANRA